MQPDPAGFEPLQPEIVPEPAPVREPFWGYLDLLWLLGIVIAGVMVVFGTAAVFLVKSPALQGSGPFLIATQFLFYGIVYLGFLFVFHVQYHKPVMASLGWRRSPFHLGIAAGAGMALAFALQPVLKLLHAPEVKSPIELFTSNWVSLVLIALTAVIAAPLFEELFFRGFLQPLLSRSLGTVMGIVVTGSLFGAMHVFEYSNAWQYGVAIALVGVTLGAVRASSGSVIPSTVMHACFNSMSVIALVASKLTKHQ